MNKYIRTFISLPKTVYINFKLFPVKMALRLPLFVSWDVKFKCRRGQVVLSSNVKPAMVQLGITTGSFNISDGRRTIFEIQDQGECVFNGTAKISKGSAFVVAKKGKIEIGNNFFCNANFLCSVAKYIKFGDDFLAGWDCTVIDGDGHSIVQCENRDRSVPKDVVIGNHVWISAHSCLLKGTYLPDETVVSYGALVSGRYNETNSVLGNNKAQVIKDNITWE